MLASGHFYENLSLIQDPPLSDLPICLSQARQMVSFIIQPGWEGMHEFADRIVGACGCMPVLRGVPARAELMHLVSDQDFFLQTNILGANHLLVGVLADGKLVAAAKVKEQDEDLLGIVALASWPRGRGHGTVLVDVLKKVGFESILVNATGPASAAFWARKGFAQRGSDWVFKAGPES